MSTSWHETLTWRSNLVYELPVGKLQTISGNDAVEIILCEKSNANQPLSPANIQRRQTISSGEVGQLSWSDSFLKSGKHSCIVVDMRSRTQKVECNFSTKDPIKGTAVLHVSYRVTNPKKVVFDVEDALSDLIILCQKTMVAAAKKLTYEQIMDDSILEDALKSVNTAEIGIRINEVHIPEGIKWPEDLMRIISQQPILKANEKLNTVERQLLEDRLRSMRIPENVINIVLARRDEDLKGIFDAAETFYLNKKQSRQEARDFLVDLIDKGLIPRATLEEKLIPDLIEKTTSDITEDPDPIQFLLSSSGGSSKNKVLPTVISSDNNASSPNTATNIADTPSDTTYSVGRTPANHEISEKRETHSYTRKPAKPRDAKKE